MNRPSIAQQIQEQRQCLAEIGDLVAKRGKGESLARHRQEIQQAILATLEWCRDNADELRDYRRANEKPPTEGQDK